MKDNPTSFVAQKARDMLDESLAELDGLNEVGIKSLHFFLTEIAGFAKYRIDILHAKDPKQIVISVFDNHQREVYFKPKSDEIFRALATKIGVPKYIIRFKEKGEVYGDD